MVNGWTQQTNLQNGKCVGESHLHLIAFDGSNATAIEVVVVVGGCQATICGSKYLCRIGDPRCVFVVGDGISCCYSFKVARSIQFAGVAFAIWIHCIVFCTSHNHILACWGKGCFCSCIFGSIGNIGTQNGILGINTKYTDLVGSLPSRYTTRKANPRYPKRVTKIPSSNVKRGIR